MSILVFASQPPPAFEALRMFGDCCDLAILFDSGGAFARGTMEKVNEPKGTTD